MPCLFRKCLVRDEPHLYVNVSQFSMTFGNTCDQNQSSSKPHILPTSLLFRPCTLKTMLEMSCWSALSPLGKSGRKGNIFLFSSPLYMRFPVLYVIHHQYQDQPLVLNRSPTFPPEKLHVSGSNIWLWAAQEPSKENHTLYFSISLQMKIEGSRRGAVRVLWLACWGAPSPALPSMCSQCRASVPAQNQTLLGLAFEIV